VCNFVGKGGFGLWGGFCSAPEFWMQGGWILVGHLIRPWESRFGQSSF
jgi:hypothetical protein